MEVNSVGQSPQSMSNSPPEPSASSALSSDFETFLRMLTTQLENQDPLNPIESSDYAVQLATFSGVEQQVRTNDLLEEMINGNSPTGLGEVAGWVGMEARVAGTVRFDGTPVTLAPNIDTTSDAAFLVVRDTNGQFVSREQLPLNASTVLWAGTSGTGSPLPSGDYSFEVESVTDGEVTSINQIEYYSLITEARLGNDGIDLVLNGGATVSAENVQALRSPAPI